jgi:hypothetical protein
MITFNDTPTENVEVLQMKIHVMYNFDQSQKAIPVASYASSTEKWPPRLLPSLREADFLLKIAVGKKIGEYIAK